MPFINVVNGSDVTYDNAGLAQGVGTTFQINAPFFQIFLNDDDTVFNGDEITNETPDDTNQTVDLGGGPVAAFYDFSFQADIGGITYTFAAIDVDVNNDGDVGTGFVGGADPGEQLFYLGVIGPVPNIPPGGVTATVTNQVNDNTNLPLPEFICFATGTLISTANGPLPVEDIRPGTRVQTMDNGYQPLIWSAGRRVPAYGANGPIRFAPGTLGNSRSLVVSPQHRMLTSDWRTQLYTQSEQLFVPAHHFIGQPGVTKSRLLEIDYVHLLFERHEVIFAEGTPTESLHPRKALNGQMGDKTKADMLTLFPDLGSDPNAYGPTARRCAQGFEAKLLA